jgi:WD40 repeat protein
MTSHANVTVISTFVLAATLLYVTGLPPTRGSGQSGADGVLWSISVEPDLVLEDIRPDGVFLSSGDNRATLSLRRAQDGKLLRQFTLSGWDKYSRSHRFSEQLYYRRLIGPYRLLKHAERIVGVEYPWLVLMDDHGREIRRVLPADELTDVTSPLWHDMFGPDLLAISLRVQDDFVAIAYNYASRPQIFIYNADLTEKLHSWPKDRYINDICWSPDGTRIAVLYSQLYNPAREYVGLPISKMQVTYPDVEIIDATSGVKVNEFLTGGRESKLAFDPNGSTIYTISQANNSGIAYGHWGPEVIRTFSANTGSLARTIKVRGAGVHGTWAFSADGRFIAANASAPLWHFPLGDIPPGFNERWLVLQAASGKEVFRCVHKTNGDLTHDTGAPLFSPDGDMLIVPYLPDLSRTSSHPIVDHITAYRVP